MMSIKLSGTGLVLMLIGLSGCSKATVDLNPSQTETVQPQIAQPSRQGIAERIAEIDRQLAAPLTGTPTDSDRRVALRAERNALTGRPGNQSYEVAQRTWAEAQATRDHQQMVDRM